MSAVVAALCLRPPSKEPISSDPAFEFLHSHINDSAALCVCVCVFIYTWVCCVMKPSPVLSHLSNYSARLSWPVGTLRRLNSTLSLVYKTTAGQTGEHTAALAPIITTPCSILFYKTVIKSTIFYEHWKITLKIGHAMG